MSYEYRAPTNVCVEWQQPVEKVQESGVQRDLLGIVQTAEEEARGRVRRRDQSVLDKHGEDN